MRTGPDTRLRMEATGHKPAILAGIEAVQQMANGTFPAALLTSDDLAVGDFAKIAGE
ncbi:MAG: hypothetical protein ABI459_10450 [Deltaproteobacteria bacterium]